MAATNHQVDCSCGQRIGVRKEHIGKAVKCPACGASVVVPVPVWAPVQLEALPQLRAEPVFSSYTLPPPRPPSLWSQYKTWVLGGLAAVVGVTVLVSAIVGLVWASKFLEPSTAGPRAQPTAEAQPQPVPGGAPAATRSPAAQPAMSSDTDDYENDSPPAKRSDDDNFGQ